MMRKSKIIKKIIITSIILSFIVIISIFIDLYRANIVFKEEIKDLTSIKMYDDQGEVFYEINNLHEATSILINEISDEAINTFITIEDKRFYQHSGFDIYSIIRAFFNNIGGNDIIGGSTITQQYIKNIYLSNKKSYIRKTREIYYAIKLESIYSKEEILEGYLNSIYFNHGIYGIHDASRYYFNVSPKDLTYAQAAVLAAIIKSPTNYSPDNNYEKNLKRKEIILKTLYEEGVINSSEYDSALNEKIIITKTKYQKHDPLTLYYKDMVLDELAKLNIKNKRLDIYTSFNRKLNSYLNSLINNSNLTSNIAVIIQNNKGQILALLGDKSYSGFNIATSGERQIGSTIKPMLYYLAIENGFTPLTSFISQKETFYINHQAYKFQNYNNLYANKKITLAYALATSDNIYAVKTHLFLKSQKLINFLKSFKIKNVEDYPSLALGSVNINLIKLSSIYNTFSTLGKYYEPSTVTKITIDNKTSYVRKTEGKQKLNKSSCYILNELMTGIFDTNLNNINQVTGSSIAQQINTKCAAKTGTTDYDSYIMGFTPYYTVSIWTGNIDNSLLTDKKAKSYPKELFAKTINFLSEENKNIWYQKPNDIYMEFVDPTGFNTGYKKLLPFKVN